MRNVTASNPETSEGTSTEGTSTDGTSGEVAYLKQVERELNARLRQQAAITELSQRALDSSDLDHFLNETVQMMAQILEVELSKVLELLPDSQELLLRAGVGFKEEEIGQVRISGGPDTQAGYTLLRQEPVITSDFGKEERFRGSNLLLSRGVISGMTVVIPGKTRPYGILSVHTTEQRHFNQDDSNFLQGVANLLASVIERIRAEEALRSSRDQLEIILGSIADGITVQDRTGRLVYANPVAARMIGFESAEELVNTPPVEILKRFELLNEEGKPFPLELLPGRQALQNGQAGSATIRFRNLNTGEERWSVVKARPVFNQSGLPVQAVNFFQDITELKRNELSQRLLAEAGELLSSTLDYISTLSAVARLAVTYLADWCVVYIIEEDQTVRPLAVAHADPLKVDLAHQYHERFPTRLDEPGGLAEVLRTGKPEYYPEIRDELLETTISDPDQLAMIRELGLKSVVIIPLVARDRTLGAITFVWAESGRSYTSVEVALAEELAQRSAIAIDNARLYQEAQQLNTELEARVMKRTNQLQTLIGKLKSEIAERRKAEEALRKSETMLQSLFESAPDAIVLIDEGGTIVRVNAQAEKLFGYGRDDLVGKPVEVLLPGRFRENHRGYRTTYFREPRARPMGIDLDLHGKRKDGHEFPIDIMLSPVQTDEGLLVISAIRDITYRKEAERKLRDREAELAEVHRRLIESVEAERLHLSQELHDGPIQDLYGLSYQLKEIEEVFERTLGEGFSPEDRETLFSADETVRNIIQYLRSICGELRPPALAPFGLEKAIEAYLEQVQEKHPDLNLHIELMPDGQALSERVRLALYRILQHTISNVLRHAKASQLKVRFTFDETQIVLEMEDDGRGFELPARWVDLARSGHLGLVGTVERAEAIGGRLMIRSSPGKGTQVQVIVPQNQVEAKGGMV